jgi:hypothetical protein
MHPFLCGTLPLRSLPVASGERFLIEVNYTGLLRDNRSAILESGGAVSNSSSDRNPLNLIERDFIIAAVKSCMIGPPKAPAVFILFLDWQVK